MKNALRVQARGAFFFAALTSAVYTFADSARAENCSPPGTGENIALHHVYDGDTLTLNDGRRVRLIGVNTPERGRKGSPDQPLALQAKQSVEHALKVNGSTPRDLRLYLGREQNDTHGRLLGHIFVDGQSLTRRLLSQGLGWHVVVPPNTGLAPCFAAAERNAKDQKKGLWRSTLAQFVAAKTLKKGGYQRIRGIVRKVNFADAWWITFDDAFVAVIYPENQRYFDRATVSAWRGKRVEVEGWVYAAKYRGQPQWRVKLATPYGISAL